MKMIKMFVSAGLICALFMLTSCATIMTKTEQMIPINSTPSEATVKIADASGNVIQNANTPCTVTLKKGAGYFKKAEYIVTVAKDGYTPVEFKLTGEMNVWYIAGNFVFGGFLGWLVVDPITGGMWTLTPEQINANLSQKQSSLFSEEGITIVLQEQVPAELAPYLVPVNMASDS